MKKETTKRFGSIGGCVLALLLCLVPFDSATAEWATDLFTDSPTCKRCHNNIRDADGENVSFIQLWETTMMRFSFLDPVWRAKARSEALRNPGAASAIEKKCARCHAPMASEQAIQNGDEVFIFDGGFADDTNPYHPVAMEGVGCTLCHQVTPDFLTTEDPFSGHFQISDQLLAWGPFAPNFAATMQRQSGYRPQQATHLGTSEFCATCHDLFTDYYDSNGDFVGTPETLFAEQTPYLEWQESSFSSAGTQCQDCHMTPAALTKISAFPRRTRTRKGVQRHTFYTENTMMLSIIESVANQIGLNIPDLGDAIIEGQEYLAGAGSIKIESYAWEGNTLIVTVRVRNEAGHKLPTGIPLRRAFINFAVYAEDGEKIFSSGGSDTQGHIIGVASDLDPLAYEPHYTTIDSEDQVQVYEGIMGNTDGQVTYTLLRASHFIKDNRLLPKGFNKTHADENVRPVGSAMADNDFKGGEDRVTYRIEGVEESVVHVEAELKDQTLASPMVEDLFLDSDNDPGGPIPFFQAEYESYKTHFELIDSDVVRDIQHP